MKPQKEIRILIATWGILLLSCNNQSNNVELETFDDTVAIKECVSEKQLPEGVFLGEVQPYIGKNKMEKNMITQFNAYGHALYRRDFDNASHYLYKDAIKYFRKFYPGESDEEIVKNFFAVISEEMVQAISRYRERGLELNIVVSRINRKVTQGNNVIYVFEILTNIVGDKLQIHMSPEETIAISTNAGKNWVFNAVNEDTPNILRVSFSDEVVDKVMGY